MLKVVAKGTFYEDKIDEAKKLYQSLVDETRKEDGCIAYSLFQDTKDKRILTVIEEWENPEYLKIHQNSEHFKRLVPMIGKLRENSEINVYELVI